MSTFWRIALGCQLPVRSGCPSAVRGVGPEGGQLGSPPRPCADTALEVSKAAATAATTRVKCLTTRCMQAGYHRTARITSHRRCLLENSIRVQDHSLDGRMLQAACGGPGWSLRAA